MLKCDGESYTHAAARHVIAEWLRAGCEYDEYHQALGLRWRVNRGGPLFGVLEELPLVCEVNAFVCEGHVAAPDECGLTADDGTPLRYDQLTSAGDIPTAILDIGIQHKGSVIYGIEVCASHAVPDAKWDFLDTLNIDVYEVDAKWILAQTKRPEQLRTLRYRSSIEKRSRHSIEVQSRYDDAREWIELYSARHALETAMLHRYIKEMFYDSKAGICSVHLRWAVTGSVVNKIRDVLRPVVSQFYVDDGVGEVDGRAFGDAVS